MNDLNNVPSSGTFGAAINEVNSNFSLVVNAINSLEYATTHSKGIYNNGFAPSTTTLPNSVDGDWCMVLGTGNTFPARIWTFNGTTWSQGGTWNPDGLDLTGYATTTAMNTAIANSLLQATARMGYGEATASNNAYSVSIANYTLPTNGGVVRVKMPTAATGAATLNITNTGAKTLWYNGLAVTSENTWEAGETISVFYDGTKYLSSNSQGGGGKAEKIKYNNTQSGLSSTNVQGAIDELKSGVDLYTINETKEGELEISDENRNVIGRFYNGHFKTKKFDSSQVVETGSSPAPLDINDENGYTIVRFENGHIKTRNFDSSNFASLFHSNLYQKKMCIIGDSYVANHQQSYTLTWHYLIAQENEMVYANYGINGNGLVASGSPATGTPVVDRYGNMDNDADYVVVVGGKNDYNTQISIASFKTGLATLCSGLISKYVERGSKIAFFTPWDDYDSGTDPSSIKLIEYVDAIIEVCGKYSIPVFDSSRRSSMYMFNSTFRTNYCQSSTDISHLNANGHKLFKNKAFNFLNQL